MRKEVWVGGGRGWEGYYNKFIVGMYEFYCWRQVEEMTSTIYDICNRWMWNIGRKWREGRWEGWKEGRKEVMPGIQIQLTLIRGLWLS